jgi:hypothetical protein
MRKETREKIESLQVTDVYSLILFAIYKMRDVPEYSTLSELAYILDKDSLFNFLEFYGGTTIKVPTLQEFNNIIRGLVLYQAVNLEGVEFSKAFRKLEPEYQTSEIKEAYFHIVKILDKYDFRRS